MSHYTYLLPAEIYRWMVSDEIIPNKGSPCHIQAR